MLRTFVLWFFGVQWTLLMSVAAIIGSCLKNGDRKAFWVMQRWAQAVLWLAGVKPDISFAGAAGDGPRIFLANHQGNCDIVLLSGYMPWQFQWIAKRELFRIPVFGKAMLRAGHIPIDRACREHAYASLDAAVAAVQNGRSVMIFPEGTRSRSGELGNFKRGASYLAYKSGAPVVPVLVEGSRARMLPGTYTIHPGPVRMTLWPARPVAGLDQDGVQTLIDGIRDEMQAALHQSELTCAQQPGS